MLFAAVKSCRLKANEIPGPKQIFDGILSGIFLGSNPASKSVDSLAEQQNFI